MTTKYSRQLSKNLIVVFSSCKATASSMTLHGSNTSLASADQTLSGSETEDLVTPQVIFVGLTCIQRSENQP